MRTFFFTFILALTFIALPVFAADNFVPLAPIPNLDTGSGATLGSYVNSVFLLVISVAAMLAVLRIVIGGFQYMTQEAVDDKQTARNTIQNAVIGLILLLGVYLILSVINPQILSLDALQFKDLRPSPAALKNIAENKAIAEARRQMNAQQATEFGNEGNYFLVPDPVNPGSGEMRSSSIRVDNISGAQEQRLISSCRSSPARKVKTFNKRICQNGNTGTEYASSGRLQFFRFTAACESRGGVTDTEVRIERYIYCFTETKSGG